MNQYDNWKEYEGASEGSGRSEKIWLENAITGEIGLFKYPKSLETTEHVSEKLASELARLLELPCAKVEIGIYGSRIGSMSYLINSQDEILIEGISLINRKYPYYNADSLFDESIHEYYSLEMILTSIEDYNIKDEFLKIMVFDFLIGNSDRHQNNWAVLEKDQNITICPIYDNGSSLCCYITGNQIKEDYLGNDLARFDALVNSKSKSRIRINKIAKREPTHYEVLQFIIANYRNSIIDFADLILSTIKEDVIFNLLDKYDDNLLSQEKKELIKRFVLVKIGLLGQLLLRKEE